MGKATVRVLAMAAICCAFVVSAGAAGAAQGGKARGDRFDACDANKDGFLSREEFKSCFKRMKPENADKRFESTDADKDGRVSKDEMAAARARIAERKREGAKRDSTPLFDRCDADKDSFLSKEEFRACFRRATPERADKRFAAFDADKDGKISKAEWEAARAAMQERRAAGKAAGK